MKANECVVQGKLLSRKHIFKPEDNDNHRRVYSIGLAVDQDEVDKILRIQEAVKKERWGEDVKAVRAFGLNFCEDPDFERAHGQHVVKARKSDFPPWCFYQKDGQKHRIYEENQILLPGTIVEIKLTAWAREISEPSSFRIGYRKVVGLSFDVIKYIAAPKDATVISERFIIPSHMMEGFNTNDSNI